MNDAVHANAASRRAEPPIGHWRRYRTLYLLAAVCAAPVVASYFAYYVAPPAGRTNYGELVLPQRPVPDLQLRHLDGRPFDLRSLRGRWVMVTVDRAACGESCQTKLWNMRQVRLTTGKERDRIERVFLVVDGEPLQTTLLREYDGTLFLRARDEEIAPFLTAPDAPASDLEGPIWFIDPLGNLMLRWPQHADPQRMKRDVGKLLKASQVG